MMNALNFVRGAVSTKDMTPVLKNIFCYDGRLQGSDGKLTIDAPCKDLKGFNFTVPCAAFLKAVDACQGEPKLVIKGDSNQSLQITRDKFKATLPLDTSDSFPHQTLAGEEGTKLTGTLLPVLRTLRPFVSEDASRPWACGILFRNGNAYATNNIIVAGIPAVSFPQDINLPGFLVDELLRLNLEPETIVANSDSITFRFSDSSWCKSSLLAATWPPVENMVPESATEQVPKGLIRAVEQVLPFCLDPKQPLIFLGADGVKTSDGDKSATVGGFELAESVYRAEPLLAVLRGATHVNFSDYPKPAGFQGLNGLRGLLVGVSV